jgi:prepilin-type N-terminal cleavage/methylation domain-containing protein
MRRYPLTHAAGFTLVEMMVVVVLAGVVTLGLVAFYINSQATWLDASTQAMAQRDATTILDAMRKRAKSSAQAIILPAGGGTNHALVLYDNDLVEVGRFLWDPADSTIHWATGADPSNDQGPVVPTKVQRFWLRLDPALPSIVHVDTLRVYSTTGQTVQLASTLAMYNAP